MNQTDKISYIATNTKSISQNYVNNLMPLQRIVQTIALQNKQIYELQAQYIRLAQIQKNNKPANEKFLVARYQSSIVARKQFLDEALKANENKYKNEYQVRKDQLEGQIKLKRQVVSSIKNGTANIFLNFSEGVLQQLLDETKHDQQVHKTIKYWKNNYQREIKNQKHSE